MNSANSGGTPSPPNEVAPLDAARSMPIGDLARATGVAVGTLRMWETRYGFPASIRTEAGHRRYDPSVVARVIDVQRRRENGMVLTAAISASTRAAAPAGSVYASVCRDQPELPRHQLRKSTLAALSRAFEDEVMSTGTDGHLFGAFQSAEGFAQVSGRWQTMARTAETTMAMADFDEGPRLELDTDGIEFVNLDRGASMRREWAVVNDSPGLPLALSGWEVPGQGDVPDGDRLFESVWTVDPNAVRSAARAFCAVAAAAGSETASKLLTGSLADPPAEAPDLMTVTRALARAMAYLDVGSHPG